MGFPRQGYRNRLPFPSPGNFQDLKIKPMLPTLVGRFFITEPPGKSRGNLCARKMLKIVYTHKNRTLCIRTQKCYTDHWDITGNRNQRTKKEEMWWVYMFWKATTSFKKILLNLNLCHNERLSERVDNHWKRTKSKDLGNNVKSHASQEK